VGLTAPLRSAEGAASGSPLSRSSACITGCAGQRSATVGRPALTAMASGAPGRRGNTIVSAPGQNAAASASARSSKAASALAATASGTWTISGLKSGRPLAR
jgi:hypothetical protein